MNAFSLQFNWYMNTAGRVHIYVNPFGVYELCTRPVVFIYPLNCSEKAFVSYIYIIIYIISTGKIQNQLAFFPIYLF